MDNKWGDNSLIHDNGHYKEMYVSYLLYAWASNSTRK